jgi:hypothetical protein
MEREELGWNEEGFVRGDCKESYFWFWWKQLIINNESEITLVGDT